MFGLSPNKLLFTVLIVVAVWYGFKWLSRAQANQKKTPPRPSRGNSGAPSHHKAQDAEYEDLVACPKCGDYVIAGKKSGCGKDGCPYDK